MGSDTSLRGKPATDCHAVKGSSNTLSSLVRSLQEIFPDTLDLHLGK